MKVDKTQENTWLLDYGETILLQTPNGYVVEVMSSPSGKVSVRTTNRRALVVEPSSHSRVFLYLAGDA